MNALTGRLHMLRAQAGVAINAAVRVDASPGADILAGECSLGERVQRLRPKSLPEGSGRLSDAELADLLGGTVAAPGVILMERQVPLHHAHGNVLFNTLRSCELGSLHEQWSAHDVEGLLFLDTETSGLAGGAGTVVFVLALAKVRGNTLYVQQYFLTAFAGEEALMSLAVDSCRDVTALVSYNGKSFDIPLLCTRARLARVAHRFSDLPHLDLLHMTRRAFSKQWPDCRLQTAERQLLGLHRIGDLPGSEVPEVWFEWLRFGRIERIPEVIEHNRLDVLSLVALLARLAQVYAEPHENAADALALAKHFAKNAREDKALAVLSIASQPSVAAQLELARLHQRQGDMPRALALWECLGQQGVIGAILNLAKFHEHALRDAEKAAQFTEELLRAEPENALHAHRYERLQRKLRAGHRRV